MTDPSRRSPSHRTTRTAVLILAVAALAVVILTVCYVGSWWLFTDRTRRENEMRHDNIEFDHSDVDAAQQQASEVRGIDAQIAGAPTDQQTSLANERRHAVDRTCQLIAHITGNLPTDLASFRTKECL